jgi:hypothetical protein
MISHAVTILVPAEIFGRQPELFAQSRLAEELRRAGCSMVTIKVDERGSVDAGALLLGLRSEPSPWMVALTAPEREQVVARTFLLLGERAPGILDVLERHGLAGVSKCSAMSNGRRRRVTTMASVSSACERSSTA